jgi:hypothetical protein
MTAARLMVSECSVSTSSFLGYRPAEAYPGAVAAAGNPRDRACGQPQQMATDGNEVLPGRQKSLLPRTSIKPGKAE